MANYYHEPPEELSGVTRDAHRGLATLIEELEAVDWYHQRIDRTADEELKAVLIHHRDEEIEHAAMALEWLRRRMPEFEQQLRTYLFTSAPITEVESAAETGASEGPPVATGQGDLGIGKFKKEV